LITTNVKGNQNFALKQRLFYLSFQLLTIFSGLKNGRSLQASSLALQSLVKFFKVDIKGNYNFQPRNETSKQGWYSRGYLPHFDGGETAQFITARLFDSVPQEILAKWREQLKQESRINNFDAESAFRQRVEMYLDKGYGNCFLRNKAVAEIVQNALIFHNGQKYQLHSWVIMPNHIHFLLSPKKDFSLSEIVHSIKSFTAKEANKVLNRRGIFWQHEPFDRYIRNNKHFSNVIRYIEENPVKAKLCVVPEDWKFSSASFRADVSND
jgi:REP element-mobilizing transposase RayT